jgi:protein-tyrosine phosphatase
MRVRITLGLLAVCVALIPLTLGSVGATGIENPTCELIGPGVYRLDFQASPDAGPVEVFASSRPDRIDSDKPVLTIRRTPAEVSLPGRSGRIYFHLKPASGATRVVSIRRLPLEGSRNFRDLGGYRSADGRYVRWGLIYRSSDLADLTAKDIAYLDGLGIRLVCDVRTEGERKRSPTNWTGHAPELLSAPIGPERNMTLTAEEIKRKYTSPEAQSKDAARAYERLVIEYAAQYGNILRRLAAGNLPAVEHCSSGKDRTGVFSAILLTALGVPREVVMKDYLLSTRYLLAPDSIQKTSADLQRIFGIPEPLELSTVQAIMTTRPEALESAFDSITKTYGSFDSYLRDGLKISDSELAMIRQRLLEP